MRPTALIPALCYVVALVLAFLCLFAGHKKDFMEDYHLITLNTSRIGQNLLNSSSSLPGKSDNPLSNLIRNATDSLTDAIQGHVNDAVDELAERLGVDDFYSAHLLDYCWGDYTNNTSGAIRKNVTDCSNQTAMHHFDPTTIIEQKLNESGVGIDLEDLKWPDEIQSGIDALVILQKAVFVLYCIAIGVIFIALIASALALFSAGRLIAFINILLGILAFLAIGLASAIVTAVIVKGSNVINKYGKDIGIEAQRGKKFLAITWATTGILLLATLIWCFEACIGHRRQSRYVSKHG